MEFQIVKAEVFEYQAIEHLICQVWESVEHKEWFVADDADYIRYSLQAGNGIGYKAVEKESGALAAVLIVTFPGKSQENLGRDAGFSEEELICTAHMDSAAVLPAYRGYGLQYRLMQEAEAELKSCGFRYLMCTVHPDNRFSRDNVMRQGYEVVATKEKYSGFMRDIFLKRMEN